MTSSDEARCQVCECSENSCRPCKSPEECTNCVSCCCSEQHILWRQKRIQRGVSLEYVSLIWMTIEVVVAIGAGILASSFALIAFGSDSVVELASAGVVLRHLRSYSSSSITDEKNDSLLTSILLIAIVPLIGLSSTYAYFIAKIRPDASIAGLLLAAGAIILMPILWRQKRIIGVETACVPLSIDALESATCFFMSLALFGGLLLEFLFKVPWFDYGATLVILTIVGFEARESFKEARNC